jgi:AcrR family transcriptional regulator
VVQTDSRYVKIMPGTVNRKVEQGATTRGHLVEVARRLFAAHGYGGTSIEAVLKEADVSRGALYHHFESKDALFAAVLEAVEADVARAIAKAASRVVDPVDALRAGCDAWLKLARDPVVRQVALIDAPAVVGWQQWRAIDERYAFGLLKAGLQRAAAAGRLRPEHVELLAHMLLAALAEVALVVARAGDATKAIREGQSAVHELLDRLLRA